MNMLLTAGLVAISTFVVAQTGVEVDRKTAIALPSVTERQARDIAWGAGLVHVDEIMRLDDRWEVAGRNRAGDELALDIDLRDGRVLGRSEDWSR